MDELKVSGVNISELKAEYDAVQYIVIKLGNEQYGIDIKFVDNIVRMQHITRVPKVADYLKGVINLRGEVIPVMSLRIKMELPADEYTKATRIIILKLEQHGTIGVIVDEVKEVVALEEEEIEKVSYDGKDDRTNFVSAVGKHEDELISLLDLNAVAMENK